MQRSAGARFLDWVERTGNRLPDPAVHFLLALSAVWIASALLAPLDFGVTDPRTGGPLRVINQLSLASVTRTMEGVVGAFAGFPPLGVVLVLGLGVGIAESSGLVGAALQRVLQFTPASLLTPMIVTMTLVSSSAGDAALLVMAPLGGAAFYAAGRHPVAGIMAAFTANMMLIAPFFPTGIDVVLQSITQKSAQMLNASLQVNPLCNWWFNIGAGTLTTLVCWLVIDRIIEPRLAGSKVDGDPANLPQINPLSDRERRGLRLALITAGAIIGLIILACAPADSPLRAPDGTVSGTGSPLIKAIVPILLLLTAFPGMVYGYTARVFTNHHDVVKAMAKTMSSLGYYLVMVFFAAQFIRAFNESNVGALIALKGGLALKAMALPPLLTLAGLIGFTSLVNLLMASASAKWAMLGPVFVPMLMTAGITPEATQLAYRIGDSPTNILTPLNPYFPLVVAFCARYVRGTGIGTIISLALPLAGACMAAYLVQLAVFWTLRIPFGI
jgi:aminobenzoyl-glutamate transport protein